MGPRLDQARGDRQRRHLAARSLRPRRGGRSALPRRLQGVPLHHRGPGRWRAALGGRLRDPDAVGRADRHRAGPCQPLGSQDHARLFPRRIPRPGRRHAVFRFNPEAMTRGWAKGSSEGLDVFYPIVPDIRWLERLVPLGLRTVQLRIKNAAPDEVRRQVASALEVTRRAGCQLIVNDYWREAIEAGADYIHLGQEDLAAADLPAIKATGMRLGISTHSEEELEIALAADPDYVALGPIYETKLKAMKGAPQ